MARNVLLLVQRANEWLAIKLSAQFATMTAFYAFLALSLLPAAWPASMSVVQFISSGVLQLVALPLIAVSGVLLGRKAEVRAEQDHAALMELVAELHAKHDAAHGARDDA
jgi:ABC-type transport system involved in cytochrome bd biosynthesis fused ATPase/permease subunit